MNNIQKQIKEILTEVPLYVKNDYKDYDLASERISMIMCEREVALALRDYSVVSEHHISVMIELFKGVYPDKWIESFVWSKINGSPVAVLLSECHHLKTCCDQAVMEMLNYEDYIHSHPVLGMLERTVESNFSQADYPKWNKARIKLDELLLDHPILSTVLQSHISGIEEIHKRRHDTSDFNPLAGGHPRLPSECLLNMGAVTEEEIISAIHQMPTMIISGDPLTRLAGVNPAIDLIITERIRQITEEYATDEKDDTYEQGQLANAASCYAMTSEERLDISRNPIVVAGNGSLPCQWPWAPCWWKPTPDNRLKELVKAAALILAEIERLLRKSQKQLTDAK